ncbi:MAG: DUF4340 domain-containing protein [Spirochaetales bacterium]|nr:DUF4340 domain-containing protein [Spirochaetales bacterium]
MNKKKQTRSTIIMYGVFAAVAVALVLYIVLRRPDRMQYGLPEITQVAAESIDFIRIQGADEASFELIRTGESWKIQPGDFRPDPDAVKDMIESLVDLKLTDLVSTSSSYVRYELDEVGRIRINASSTGETVREFDLGKRAPSYNHTYLKLGSDPNIYQAATDMRRIYDRTVQDIRDKNVLSFIKEEVVKLGVTLKDRDFRLFKAASTVGSSGAASDSAAPAVVWNSSDESLWPAEKVDELLDRLDDLTCTEFLIDKDIDLGPALLVLDIQDQEDNSFSLFGKDETGYKARSSQTPYAFYISIWQGDNILEPFTDGEPDDQ